MQGAQENCEAKVIQESNDHAAVAQRKLKVKQLKGKTNADSLVNKQVHNGANLGAVIWKTKVPGQEGAEGNAAERYRGDNNMAALGVATVIEEYAHDSLTFRDAVSYEVISKWISVMKEDMETRSNYMGFTCKSKVEIWVTKGLLDEAKDIILGMEIFRTLSGNTLRRVVCHGIVIKKRRVRGHEYITLTEKLKEDTWLKGLSTESGFELRLVAGIATCALTKVVLSPRFQHWLKLLHIGEGLLLSLRWKLLEY
ncbi:hypothetical protein Tco_1174949 [Tanacetum coccineum]